jgi:hypothetical protein
MEETNGNPESQGDFRENGTNGEYKVGNCKPPLHTQFKKEQSGCPGGAGRYRPLTELLARHLDEIEPKSGKTYGELFVKGTVRAARRGREKVITEVFDRIEGKVPDKVQVSGGDGGPMVITVVEAVRPMSIEAVRPELLDENLSN